MNRATGAGYVKLNAKYETVYEHVIKKYNYKCGLCGYPLGIDGEVTQLHRIKPGKDEGRYTKSNVMPVHAFCHKRHHRLEAAKAKSEEPR